MFQTKVVMKIKTYFMFNDYHALYETMWGKCRRAGQASDDNMAQAPCMLDT
jgi:hypothetical protein